MRFLKMLSASFAAIAALLDISLDWIECGEIRCRVYIDSYRNADCRPASADFPRTTNPAQNDHNLVSFITPLIFIVSYTAAY